MSRPTKPLNILLVEDLADDRFIFQYALKKARPDAQVFTADDGLEALDYFQNRGRFADGRRFPSPDFMFLDLKMPGRNGFEVLQWMNERSLLSNLKVIVLSGSSEPQDIALARQLGAREYIVKPVTSERLDELLRM